VSVTKDQRFDQKHDRDGKNREDNKQFLNDPLSPIPRLETAVYQLRAAGRGEGDRSLGLAEGHAGHTGVRSGIVLDKAQLTILEHEHIDKANEEGRGTVGALVNSSSEEVKIGGDREVDPFHEYLNAEVYEDAGQEDQLGEEHEEHVQVTLAVRVIHEREEDSESHLSDAQNDTHLHLERVSEGYLVEGYVPDWIESEWESAVGEGMFRDKLELLLVTIPQILVWVYPRHP
jgi:hypothetical protein